MKNVLMCLLVFPLAACNPNPRVIPISDPPAIPFLVSVQAAPVGIDGQATLTATVKYGGFGSGGTARVEFRNGTQLLATSTQSIQTADPSKQVFAFSAAFNPVPKTAYQIRAVVSWTYGPTPGSIESSPVTYPSVP